MPQSTNFSVQNALKLAYKRLEMKKKFFGSLSLAIKGEEGRGSPSINQISLPNPWDLDKTLTCGILI
jgi:hypothetical protein